MGRGFKSHSRLMRKSRSTIKRRNLFWQIILSVSVSFFLFLLLLLLGLPLLAKLSLLLEKIRSGEETSIVIDHIPPFPPQLESQFTATNSARLTLQGISEPGSTVKLYLNDKVLEKILVGKDGTFTTRVALVEGENNITAKAIDQADNESAFSNPLLISYKKGAPLLEIEFPTEEELQTEEKEIEIKGKTDPEVNLTINDRFVRVKSNGSFSFLVSLSEGENLIKVVATDQAGNQTKKERKVTFSP